MHDSHAGRLLNNALELDFEMENLSIPWDEVSAEDVKAVQILRNERMRFQEEVRGKVPNQDY